MNFELTTEMVIMIGLFLIITFMITIIIVYFLTKIKSLNAFLEQAKEIDDIKNEKISALEIQLQEEKIYNINIMTKLKNFDQNIKTLSQRESEVEELKEHIGLKSQECKESIHHHKATIKELKSRYDILSDNYDELIEKHRLLQKRNETLVKENNTSHSRLRELQLQLDKQNKKTVKQKADSTEKRKEI